MPVSPYKRRHGSTARFTEGNVPLTDVLKLRPVRIKRSGIARQHVDRHGTAATLPLSDRHELVLSGLTDEVQGATGLGRRLGLNTQQVQSALYALQARGLAARAPGKGWRRA